MMRKESLSMCVPAVKVLDGTRVTEREMLRLVCHRDVPVGCDIISFLTDLQRQFAGPEGRVLSQALSPL